MIVCVVLMIVLGLSKISNFGLPDLKFSNFTLNFSTLTDLQLHIPGQGHYHALEAAIV